MGKKGTKRKTRWRALPLGEDEAGSGNEEELLDEDRSTNSSLAGQTTNIKLHPPVFRNGDRPYRPHRRFPYDKYRNKEPLIKLESKTFDEEEYTKITTPRQDVLFKKGYFGRKRESSMEETLVGAGEADGEETLMDQYIITNGFLDERGHYYVNGSSYEVYDPYSNTLTVVVGPPPYTNGVNQPVLAAVSCQPVPLTPVEWYPPGEDWPTDGSAWTPSYPHGEPMSNGDATPSLAGRNPPSIYQQPAYVEHGHPYVEDNSSSFEGGSVVESSAEVSNTKDSDPEDKKKKTTTESVETLSDDKKEIEEERVPKIKDMRDSDICTAEELVPHTVNGVVEEPVRASEQQKMMSPPVKQVEKQNHGTQTSISTPVTAVVAASSMKVKESHSTQTIPEESVAVEESKQTKTVTTPTKVEQISKLLIKKEENLPPMREENNKTLHQRRSKEEHRPRLDQMEVSPSLKTSYARKLLNGLGNSAQKVGNDVRAPNTNGTQAIPAQASESHRPLTKVNQSVKRSSMNKFSPGEGKRNTVWTGNVKNGYERQKYGKGPPPRRTNNRNESCKEKKPEAKVKEKPKESTAEEETTAVGETIAAESRSHSEKSSTLSELSSPTELSSGQNTPPEKLIVRKMEQKIAEDLNRSFGETLKENLTRAKEEETKEEETKEEEAKEEEAKEEEAKEEEAKEEETKEEETKEEEAKEEEVTEEEERSNVKPKKKKGKGKEEPTPKAKRQKRRRKGTEGKGERSVKSDNSPEENLFFHLYGKTQDFLSKAWESMNVEKSEPIPDFETILTAENDEILETLGIVDKWKVPKLPLASDLLTFPAFGHERPKLKFEDFFASAALKDLQNEVFTKTNITNMRSTKPEEFFASIVENPARNRGRKESGKSGKKGNRSQEDVSLKKVKTIKGDTKKAELEEVENKEPGTVQEGKLGIVDAVNSWLREQEDPEKVLSAEVLKELSHGDDQKNGLSNPIHASSAEANIGADDACIRVANEIKDDGYLGTETEMKKKEELTKLYRSSSWDAKLSEIQMKKHFQFLREATSWDRRKLKDATLRKHLKFIADSANFLYREVIGDVRNGYEIAREELCDPKQSVSKYYTLSPATLEPDRIVECEGEAFDALDFSFAGGPWNPSVTDSGVHSDSESNEETTASSDSKPTVPNREVSCKMQ